MSSGTREEADVAFAKAPPIILIVAAVYYGFHRLRGFHPAFREEYRQWLWLTPWTPSKALPLGPVDLVGADVVLLGAAVAAAWPFYGFASSLLILKAFLAAYSAALLVALLRTGERVTAYAVWFGLGAMVLLRASESLFFLTAAATYGIGLVGFRRSLARFPWSYNTAAMREYVQFHVYPGAYNRLVFGWPFAALTPSSVYATLRRFQDTAVALLCGWSLYAAGSLLPEEPRVMLYLVPVGVAFYGALVRLAVYHVFDLRPPISLAGRVSTGRWVIPAYDRVFVAPLLAIALGILAPVSQVWWPVAEDLGAAAGLSLTLLALLTLGPDRRTWMLTTPSRVVWITTSPNAFFA
jgi:hypothetical protein